MLSFFKRYRVLTVGIVGLTAIHLGWFYIANSRTFNPSQKVLDIVPAYYKSKQASSQPKAASSAKA